MFSAWHGGFASGLAATLLTVLMANVFTLTPLPDPIGFDASQLELFAAVGVVTSSLVQSLHAKEKRLKSRLNQQSAVAALAQDALVQSDLQAFLDHAVRIIATTLGVEHCKVLELVPSGEALLLRSGVGWTPGFVGHCQVPSARESQAGYTLHSSEPIIVYDLSKENRFGAPALLRDHQIVSGLSVAIPGEDDPYGVLGVHSRASHAFTAEDVDFVQTVASLLAVSIQRSRSAQMLADSEARFRSLAESIPHMVWTTTADGEVDYISQSWCEFTGLSMSKSLGYDGWKTVLHSEDAGGVMKRWQESIASGTNYEVECRLHTANGGYRWILARGVPLRDASGQIRKWFGTCTDIHSEKLAEEALRNVEKLAAAGQLAATVAHEINNPLAGVTNLVYLAMKSLDGANLACQQYLSRASGELHRMSQMVGQSLGFYKDTTAPVPTDPIEVVSGLVSLYNQKITAKHIQIRVQAPRGVPMPVFRGELRQIVANLLVNAIDASAPGGLIRLRIRNGHDWRHPLRKGIRVTVADYGSGIQAQDREKLFTPFFTTKKDVGTGLGLWTVATILQQRGGTLRYRTCVRQGHSGTAFSLLFPAAEVQSVKKPSESPAKAADESWPPSSENGNASKSLQA